MESGFPAALEMFWYVRMVHLSVSIILTYRNVKCKAGNKDDINMILSWEKTTKLNSACSRTQTKILACNPDASFGSLAQELTKLFVILGLLMTQIQLGSATQTPADITIISIPIITIHIIILLDPPLWDSVCQWLLGALSAQVGYFPWLMQVLKCIF